MGDSYQFIALPDVKETDAPAKGAALTRWLIREGIILPESDEKCVLYEEPGHPPGPRFFEACEGAGPRDYPDPITKGVAVISSRRVYFSNPDEMALRCTVCNARFVDTDDAVWQAFFDAIGEFHNVGTIGKIKCIRCETERSLHEWQRDAPLAAASLGLEFWNWPPLSKVFLGNFEKISDSTTCYLAGKL